MERVSGVVAIRADKGARAGSSYNLVPKDFDTPAPTGAAGMAAALAAEEQAQPPADELAAAVDDVFARLRIDFADAVELDGDRWPLKPKAAPVEQPPAGGDPFAVAGLDYEF